MSVTRLAPSPTGALHLGNARTFLINWMLARQNGWKIILRIEDIDGPRIKSGADQQAIDDLRWLGIDWDEGPIYQIPRMPMYRAAIEQLTASGLAYPCVCSRKEVELAASAPHAEDGATIYPGTCRDRFASIEDAQREAGKEPAIRFRVPDATVEWNDLLAGAMTSNPAKELGDFVIAKSDGTPAYQLAVVVDDAAMGVTHVVRGDDLIDSTPRQILLYRALGLAEEIPLYLHLPLVVGKDGRRLAKRHGDTRLSHYRSQCVTPQRVLALMAKWCGIGEHERIELPELLNQFDIERLPRQRITFTTHDDAWLRGTGEEMNPNREHRIRRIMSGEAKDFAAAATRAGTRIAEPFYSLAMLLRNAMFNAGIKRTHHLDRPVISIGNITTGGTGKTPTVQWIARRLLTAGHHPACLLRGYTVGATAKSDEATLLERSLGIPVRANPNRVASGRQLIAEVPETDMILLDDAFQHRRVHRDLDIVLIDATNPFGYGHVLPRGMLREPMSGLARANLFILTRTDLVGEQLLAQIEPHLRRYNPAAPILRSRHRITALVHGEESQPLESLRGRRIFSFAGIANPTGFHHDLHAAGAIDPGHRWFADHQDYSRDLLATLSARAKEANAEMMVTTEKDWVKIEPLLSGENEIPIWRAQLELEFSESGAATLMSRVESVIAKTPMSAKLAE